MTGQVLQNDGDVAIVLLDNGDRVRFERKWGIKFLGDGTSVERTREEFLQDLPVGVLAESCSVERLSSKAD